MNSSLVNVVESLETTDSHSQLYQTDMTQD